MRPYRLLVALFALLGPLLLGPASFAQPTSYVPLDGATVIFPSAARTTTATSGWYASTSNGLFLVATASSVTATPIVTFRVEIWDAAQGSALNLFPTVTTFVLDAVETVTFGFAGQSGNTANCGQTVCAVFQLPVGSHFRIVGAATDADSITYSLMAWPLR